MASREGRGSWTANGRTDGRGRTRTGGRVTRAAFHFAGGACPIRRPLPPSLVRTVRKTEALPSKSFRWTAHILQRELGQNCKVEEGQVDLKTFWA